MKKILCLVHTLTKCGGGTLDSDKKSFSAPAFLTAAGSLAVAWLMYSVGGYVAPFAGEILDTKSIMETILLFTSVMLALVSVPSIMNTFYLSSDLATLLTMPVTPGQITLAKTIVVGSRGYLVFAVLVFPFCLGYGIRTGAGFSFWVGAVCSLVIIPAFLLCITGTIIILFMRLFHRARNKDLITIGGALATLIIILAMSVFQNASRAVDGDMNLLLAQMGGAAAHVSFVIPVIPFAGRLFAGESLLWALAMAGAMLIAAVLFFLSAKYAYLPGALGMQNTSYAHKAMTDSVLQKNTRRKSVVHSYTLKELKTVIRTPSFLLQGVMLTLVWPVLVIVPMLFSKPNGAMAGMQVIFENPSFMVLTTFACANAVTLLAAALNNTASLSLSREGSSYFIMKQIPVSYKKQLKAKRNAAMALCATGTTLYLLIGGIVLLCMGKLSLWMLLFGLCINICTLIIMLDFEMLIGMLHPKLVWESDSEIGRSNPAGIFLFLGGLMIDGFIFLGGAVLLDSITISAGLLAVIFTIVFILLAFLMDVLLYHYGAKRLEKL